MSSAVHMLIAQREARVKLMAEFRERRALSPDTATPVRDRSGAFEEFLARGIVREAAPGRFYLDDAAVRAFEERMEQQNKQAIVTVISIIGLLVFFLTFLSILGL
jgi:hypothetical protein